MSQLNHMVRQLIYPPFCANEKEGKAKLDTHMDNTKEIIKFDLGLANK